ncbi:MAG: hypothetical protein KA354_02455 [Phycisphaerae bacterium]|nr:hypothetical protein [Phycisphaerae bacterium]
MRSHLIVCLLATLAAADSASAQRVWYLKPDRFDGNWHSEAAGGYDDGTPMFDGRYWWGQGFDGVRRAYWKFDNNDNCLGPEIPDEPNIYKIEYFVPSAHATAYSPLEVIMDGYDQWKYWDPNVPWNGQYGTNRQWIQTNENNQGRWMDTGPGPQCPNWDAGLPYPRCGASGNGGFVWLKRGSVMYVMFNHAWYDDASEVGVSALRITEMNPIQTGVCGPPAAGGPLDLGCVGNADALLGVGSDTTSSDDNDRFANGERSMIAKDDHTLGAEGYVRPCQDHLDPSLLPTPLTPGLPPNGVFTVQIPGSPRFQLRYDGWNSIKWDGGDTLAGPFRPENVFVLNPDGPREFLPGPYAQIHLLTVGNGDNNGELVVEAIYNDQTVDSRAFKLYNWFGTDGDDNSQAVGVGGRLRSSGPDVVGFQRVRHNGTNQSGGNHDGAFLLYHAAQIDARKTLSRIRLRIQADERGLGGRIAVVGVSLDKSSCHAPVFDAAGSGTDGTEPDGAVDQRDFGVLQTCLYGTSPFDSGVCACFDVVGDGVIDGSDLDRFLKCWTGPAPAAPVPADCAK